MLGGITVESIIIEEKKPIGVRLSCIGILMTLLSLLFILHGVNVGRFAVKLIGSFGVVVFGAGSFVVISKTMQPKPLLTISFNGLTDSSRGSSFGFISFQEIDRIEVVNVFGHKVIGVYPNNIEGFIKKLSPVKQKFAKHSVSMNLPPITIRVDSAKDMTVEDIVTLLEKRLTDYQRLYI